MESTESTPLISRFQPQLPYISPVIQRLQSQEIATLSKDHVLALCPDSLRLTPAEETAFVLVVLLQLRREERAHLISNSWDKWSQERQAQSNGDQLETQALAVWSQFVNNWCTDDALNEVLSTKFHLDETHMRSVTRTALPAIILNEPTNIPAVIELLCNEATPKRLLAHRLVDLAIHQLWVRGRREHTPSDTPLIARVASFMKRFSTPRYAVFTPDIWGS